MNMTLILNFLLIPGIPEVTALVSKKGPGCEEIPQYAHIRKSCAQKFPIQKKPGNLI